ncbi:MAG TPA: hypothetical protein VFS21_27995 [Roseiflexaceae bacterium]|nr:hypothetical protein [Roseiflexaceae bacterium]
MSTGSTGRSSPTNELPAHLLVIWTRDEWLSAPLKLALERFGYTCCVIRAAENLPAELERGPAGSLVLLLGPLIAPEEVETLIAPIDERRGVSGVWFTWHATPPTPLPPGYQPHRLPPNLRALDQTIRLLIGA